VFKSGKKRNYQPNSSIPKRDRLERSATNEEEKDFMGEKTGMQGWRPPKRPRKPTFEQKKRRDKSIKVAGLRKKDPVRERR